ncbi:cytochrome P450 [Actinomadura barringtoniae]|uniref:Cytochrome P450 n=1 Tax=Actinomadura barringtoniae TaxID=1427535 RepID=A0A939PI14_9ACTN|nr:cytochrome P450 [Actinomadura barringtoniae]MBO2452642.1 cytochrome P450 [Actinomadura barringtoniae]
MGERDFERLAALRRDPYPLYAEARETDGLLYVPELDGWLVARHADVREVLRTPEIFSSANVLRPDMHPSPEAIAEMVKGPAGGGPVVVSADGEAHLRLRAPLTRAFSGTRVAALLPFITERAGALVDAFIGDGEVELMSRYARRLPGEVIAHIYGLDPADADVAIQGSVQAERLGFRRMSTGDQVAAARDMAALRTLLDAHLTDRLAQPRDDLISEMIEALAPGAPTPEARGQILSNLSNLVIAGHLTTTALMGNAMTHLLSHREQWEMLVADPSLIPDAIDEAARYDTAVQAFRRITTRPTTLAGTELPEGAAVLVAFGAAGRDGTAHERPDVFDITRPRERHLAFGHGVHACPGAQLAREELRISLETFVRRLPGLRLAEEPRMRPSLIDRSPETLRLAWK